MPSNKKIVVIGAGISGLAAAYFLFKEGYDVVVFEQKEKVGGCIETLLAEGILFDCGPSYGLETTPLIKQLVDELNLEDQFIYANKASKKSYILKNGELHPLPMSPPSLISSKLFSGKAKLRLLAEPFISRSKDGYYQSIADFAERRLGKEFLDYAFNPFTAGVYAGKPEELSIKSAFPKLYSLEEDYGGLILGSIRSIRNRKRENEKSKQSAKMFSFKNGMRVLPEAIAQKLGSRVNTGVEVFSVRKTSEGNFGVTYRDGEQTLTMLADVVLSTVPAYKAADLFGHFDELLLKHLNEIYYPPVLVLSLVYERSAVGQPLDGSGFLIPEKEEKSFLGAVWNSVLFPNRSDEDKAAFTLFIGGTRDAGFVDDVEQIVIDRARREFELIMKISSEPLLFSKKIWSRAIPQYSLGYVEHENFFDHFEKDTRGLILSGNYRGGISVGDCIRNAELVVQKIKSLPLTISN
ncbi:MAG: protoporphyrinogen oxidase [Ignavibacteriales bacterium]